MTAKSSVPTSAPETLTEVPTGHVKNDPREAPGTQVEVEAAPMDDVEDEGRAADGDIKDAEDPDDDGEGSDEAGAEDPEYDDAEPPDEEEWQVKQALFHDGPPLWIPGLGSVPGPIKQIQVTGGLILL